MLPFAYYLLKVIICSGILFGYYWLMLRNKVFHQYNRFYLLAILVLSLTLPVIQVDVWHTVDTPAPQAIQLLQVVSSSNEYLEEVIVSSNHANFSMEQGLALLYLLITLLFSGLFIHTIFRIRTLFKKHRHSLVEDVYFVNTTAKGTPFSFLRYIFWNDHIDPESTTGHQIFKHELAHVQQKHSYDKLFINAILIFCWCNPFFWLIRKELNMIHEFMADKIAVEDSNTETFAAMILQATYPQHRFPLTNSFFYSPIKRRLNMLTKNNNTKAGYIGRILALPLTVIIFAAFTLKAKPSKINNNPAYTGKKITVVIDAGHGGSDNGALSPDGSIKEKDLTLAIIKKIKALNNHSNISLIFTRESDVFQTVKEKADFSREQNADLFISLHINAASKEVANSKTGMSVYVSRDNYANSNSSKLFAAALIQEFNRDYGLPVTQLPQQSETGIKVLQESQCPSIIIEPGYITNKKDLDFLMTSKAQQIIAEKILASVEKYAIEKDNLKIVAEITPPELIQNIAIKKNDTVPEITLKNHEKALIILDGKTIGQDELKQIKPETIESINVLKGKSGIAVYGQKGKNGVVIITSKEKELVFNNLKITIAGDSTKDTATISGNIKIRNNDALEKQPLYVIDGKVQTGKIDINSISPNDIESINVLKGKMAVDKYGEPGINGVIEIFSKSKKAIKTVTQTVTPANNNSEGMSVVKIPPTYMHEGQSQKININTTIPGGEPGSRH